MSPSGTGRPSASRRLSFSNVPCSMASERDASPNMFSAAWFTSTTWPFAS
jgi:hypothetical protein